MFGTVKSVAQTVGLVWRDVSVAIKKSKRNRRVKKAINKCNDTFDELRKPNSNKRP